MEGLVSRVTDWMKDVGDLSEDQEEVVAYALLYILLSVAGTAGILVLSWIMGIFWAGLLCAAAASSLRLMSGGAHYSSPTRCTVMSVLTFPILALLATRLAAWLPETFLLGVSLVGVLFAFTAIQRHAPVDNESKPIDPGQRPMFRLASLAVMVVWTGVAFYFLVMPGGDQPQLAAAIMTGMVWQSLSLTPTGHAVHRKLDRTQAQGQGESR